MSQPTHPVDAIAEYSAWALFEFILFPLVGILLPLFTGRQLDSPHRATLQRKLATVWAGVMLVLCVPTMLVIAFILIKGNREALRSIDQFAALQNGLVTTFVFEFIAATCTSLAAAMLHFAIVVSPTRILQAEILSGSIDAPKRTGRLLVALRNIFSCTTICAIIGCWLWGRQ